MWINLKSCFKEACKHICTVKLFFFNVWRKFQQNTGSAETVAKTFSESALVNLTFCFVLSIGKGYLTNEVWGLVDECLVHGEGERNDLQGDRLRMAAIH